MFGLKQHLYLFYLDTYIIQVRQGGCAQEESQINLRSPSQPHCRTLVYNLCCRLILIVCFIDRCVLGSLHSSF